MTLYNSDQEQYCVEECDLRLAVQRDQERQDLEAMAVFINECLGCGEVHHGELTLPSCKAGYLVCPSCYNEYPSDCYYVAKENHETRMRILEQLRESIPELPEAEIGVITWKC